MKSRNDLIVYISYLLVFLLGFNQAATVAAAGNFESRRPERSAVSFSRQGENSFLEISSLPADVKDSVLQGITDYLNIYKGTCFGDKFSIGDPDKFKAAIGKNINRFVVGADGAKMIKEKSPSAKSFHFTYKLIGMTADLVFPFDPATIPAGDGGYFNRQTMMHEMTHHIEWLNGVKESSKDVFGNENPRSERNTNYQDNAVNTLRQLAQTEENLKNGSSTIADELTRWRIVETTLRELEAGSSAGANPPDKNLEDMTGFNAVFDKIEAYYLSGACGDDLKKLIMLYRLLPRIKQNLDFPPLTIKLGEEAVGKAVLETPDLQEIPIPAELKPKYTWTLPDGRITNENPVRYKPEREGDYKIPVELSITFEKEDFVIARGEFGFTVTPDETKPTPTPTPVPSPSPVNLGAGKFSGSVFGNWTGGNTPEGFSLTRNKAEITAPCGWKAGVTASLRARFVGFNQKPKDAAEALAMADAQFKARRQGNTPNDMAVGLFMGGGREGASSFAMGDYTGAIADFAVWIRRGSAGMGYTGSYLGANGAGWVVKNGGVIEFSYQVNGGGCWENSDRAYLVTQSVAAQEEARAILASLRLDDNGLLTPKPYEGPKYDGSDLPKVSLSPAKLNKLKVGETVTVRAIVENAKAEDNPLTYNWSGTFNGKPEDYKKSAGVEIKPVKPGKYTLTVGVDGARFGMGGASLEYEVLDYKAEIKQVSPTASKVVLGVPVSFSAQLLAGGAPVSGSYVYRWQPQPEAKFEPAEGAGNQTKAVFSRPGRTKVWVQVLEKRGEVLETVAESAQIEIEAVSPALRIAFFPAQVNVGKEVRARVEVTPADLKEIDFRWEISANAKQTFISPDTREVTFIPQDTNPVSVKVHARVPFYGDDLGVQTASIAATLSQADIDKATAAANLTKAKEIIRKGQLDEAVALLDEAVRLDAKNAEAAALSAKTKNEMTIIKTQLEKFRALIQESRFPEAQKELIVASNINSYYKPVADAEVELGDSWRKYDAAVKEKLGAMQVANEYRQFRKTLDIAVQTRAELKLYGYDLERFNSFENWAQSHEAEKERQRAVLKRGEEKYRNYDFAGAYEDLNVMFAKGDFYEYWNSNYDTEPAYYQKLKDDAFLKMKRINELLPNIRSVAADERLAAPIVEKAIADCDEILKIQPPNAEAAQLRAKLTERLKTGTNTVKANEAVKRGEALHAEKKYDAAIREFDTAIKLVPNNAEAYRLRGRSKRENGDLRGSLDDFNRALEIEPNNSRSFLGRGLTRDRMNDSQGALADYTHGIELEPNYPNGYSYRGYLKTQLKDFKGAIADYDMVVALEPNNRDAYLNRGFSKAHLGDCPGAVRDYNRVIEIDPNYALAYNNRGTCREKAGDLPGALQDYEKAAGLDPSSEIFKNNLAKLKTKLAGTQTPVTTPTTKQPETEAVNVGNIYGVNNAPTAPTEFSVRTSYMLTFIQTYHWNYGRGAQPGTIAVRKDDGTVFGPWRAGTKPGQGGVPNAYWEVTPNVVIPAGTYTIIDSDPSTWSQNAQSGGRGFAVVKGSAVSQSNAPTTNTPTTAERMRISVTYVNASKQNIHIFATGENFSPENRLAPGGRRTASGEGPKFTQITVYAGANGKVFDQVTFDVVPNGKYLVTFGSNNQLTFIKQ